MSIRKKYSGTVVVLATGPSLTQQQVENIQEDVREIKETVEKIEERIYELK